MGQRGHQGELDADLGQLTGWLFRWLFQRRVRAVSRVAEALGTVEAI
ncbi:hypothetical protein ACFFX0_10265 [Citricoccus parietis]|uniref:Uncharacterized protein n=1 Tax=Citricoccus parietis TaxID=592307 RepID=A0ABV5FY05_9MICC